MAANTTHPPQATTNPLPVVTRFPFQAFRINAIVRFTLLRLASFTPHNVLRFIHVVTCTTSSFLFVLSTLRCCYAKFVYASPVDKTFLSLFGPTTKLQEQKDQVCSVWGSVKTQVTLHL